MISSKDLDMQKLIADGEWLGKQMEEEGDRARQDEFRDRQRDSESNDSQP